MKRKKLIAINCPFHKEQTPSCIIDGDSFYCLSCGKKGSIKEILAKKPIEKMTAFTV